MSSLFSPHYLSPAKRFYDRIKDRYGVELQGIYTDYVMPDGYTAEGLDALLLEDRYRTNAGVNIEPTSWLSRLAGKSRFVVQNVTPFSTPTVEARRQELLSIAKQLVELNPPLQAVVPEGTLDACNINQVYNFIWGCVCSINPEDLAGYALRLQQRGVETKADLPRWHALKHKIEAQCGEKMDWIPRLSTMESVAEVLDQNRDKFSSKAALFSFSPVQQRGVTG